MPDVVVTMSAKDAGLWQKLQEARAAATLLGFELDVVSRKSGQMASGMSGHVQKMIGDLPRAAAAFAGVGSAIGAIYTASRLIMAEYERFRETRIGAVEPYRNILQAKEQTRLMLAQETPGTRDAIIGRIEAAAGRYLRDPRDAYSVFAATHSSSGDAMRSAEITEALLEVYGPRGQFQKDGMEHIGGSMSDYMKRTGRTAREAVGMAMKGAPFTRSEGPSSLAPTLRGINALIDAGMTEEQAWALSGQFGSISNDPMGRHTSTNLIRMLEQVQGLGADLAGKSLISPQAMQKYQGLSLPDKLKFLEGGAAPGASYEQQVMLARVQGMEKAANDRIRDLAQGMGQAKFGLEGEAMGLPALWKMFGFGTAETAKFWQQNRSDAAKIRGGMTPEQVVQRFIAETPPDLRAFNAYEGLLGREEGANDRNAAQGAAMKFREEMGNIKGRNWKNRIVAELLAAADAYFNGGDVAEQTLRQVQREKAELQYGAVGSLLKYTGGDLIAQLMPSRNPLESIARAIFGDEFMDNRIAGSMSAENAGRYRRLRGMEDTLRIQIDDPAGRPLRRAMPLPRAETLQGR